MKLPVLAKTLPYFVLFNQSKLERPIFTQKSSKFNRLVNGKSQTNQFQF